MSGVPPEEAQRRRSSRARGAPTRLADEQPAAPAERPSRRRAASAPPGPQRAAQQPRVEAALSTRKSPTLVARAASVKVHPIALESIDSAYWLGRSEASRRTAAAAFGTLKKVPHEPLEEASEEEKARAYVVKGQHQAVHGSVVALVCELGHELRSSLPMRPITTKSKRACAALRSVCPSVF